MTELVISAQIYAITQCRFVSNLSKKCTGNGLNLRRSRRADIKTATIVKRIPIEGAGMLNDLAIDSKGIVCVSDTRTGKVHRIEGDKPTVYLENIPGANGKDEFLLSKYHGLLYWVKSDGTKKTLLDTQASRFMRNDIGYDEKSKILYSPAFNRNLIIAYKVK